ncbi:MAG: DnaJ domain-containing protein [Deltaproteobacteria bacterium]|nr:DnaJ domain-containing protein [Deltaproteobacteria bacterium]
MRNLYEVLGVPRDADQAAIRKAFRQLARQCHPDVNKAPDAEARFKEINAAYEVLSDEQRRAWYDEFGDASLRTGFDPEAARAWRASARPGPEVFGGGGGVDLEDLFSSLFGGGGRGRGSPFARGWNQETVSVRRRGPDMEARIEIDLLTAIRGGDVRLSLRRPETCRVCGGTGGTGRQTCPACKGSGRRTSQRFGLRAVVRCEECAGSGSVFARECAACGGSGRTMATHDVKVHVPAGVVDGQVLRLKGLGGEGRDGGAAGHLLVTVSIRPHPFLRRDGHDLEMDLPVTIGEAVGGASVCVPTPDGEVRVRIPPGSSGGQRLRLRGRGFPKPGGGRGDLFLVVRPVAPPAADEEIVRTARSLDRAYPGDVRADLRLDGS